MKKVRLLILFFILLYPYSHAHADEVCTPNNTPTILNAQNLNYEIGQPHPDYLLGITVTNSCGQALPISEVRAIDDEVVYDTVGQYNVYYYIKATVVTIQVNVYYDITSPILTVPNEIIVEVNDAYDFMTDVSAVDNKEGDVTNQIVVDYSTVDLSHVGQYLVTYTVSDLEANETVKTVVVSVVDTIKPTLSGAKDLTLEVHTDLTTISFWDGIIVNDNSGIPPTKTVDYSEVLNHTLGTYTLHYEVMDTTGNETNIDILVQIVDTTKPVILHLDNLLLNVNQQLSDIDFKEGLEVTDNYDTMIPLEQLKVDSSHVELDHPGIYPLFYFVTDSSGNCTIASVYVTVFDDDIPVIYGTRDLEVPANPENFSFLLNVTADDLTDGDLTDRIIVYDDLVHLDQVGTYPLYYVIFDSSGNHSMRQVTVVVYDHELPQISGVTDLTFEVHATVNLLEGISASDNLDGDITALIQYDTNLIIDHLGVYSITYSVEDSSGNRVEKEATITVLDTTKPEIHNASDITIKAGQTFDLLTGITATDNYDGNITSEIQISGDYSLSIKGTYTIKLEVKDSSGNTTVTYFTLTVLDDKEVKTTNYTMYYVLGAMGVGLIGAGVIGFVTRKNHKKRP